MLWYRPDVYSKIGKFLKYWMPLYQPILEDQYIYRPKDLRMGPFCIRPLTPIRFNTSHITVQFTYNNPIKNLADYWNQTSPALLMLCKQFCWDCTETFFMSSHWFNQMKLFAKLFTANSFHGKLLIYLKVLLTATYFNIK